ncbi:signal recognition particle-docking protein FtsY [Hoeflea sp. WL0058]|uniref:Signal recognition particle receptor FtsY n=1 Tax=Flavimaribacter sediminis TaxID=2865987 RepID=A0AAE3D243_9HYPH|nr:signal recognition particle-docking protein FtsY [Flavimaribacter sediminis]MBW8638541.1 signal recognition particle-docking protein FtsY [Flavimaribacter sediminis]
MALGFIKKVFSFSSKKTEDKDEDDKKAVAENRAASPRVKWDEEPQKADLPELPPEIPPAVSAPVEQPQPEQEPEKPVEPEAETEETPDAEPEIELEIDIEALAETEPEEPVAEQDDKEQPVAEEEPQPVEEAAPVAAEKPVEEDTSWEEWKPAIARRQPPIFPGLKKPEETPEAPAEAEEEPATETPAAEEEAATGDKPADAAPAEADQISEPETQAASPETEADVETESGTEAETGAPDDEKVGSEAAAPAAEAAPAEDATPPEEAPKEAVPAVSEPEEPEPKPVETAFEPVAEPSGFFARLRQGLSRTTSQLTEQISGVFNKRKLDEDTLQDLEDVLIQSDLGLETALRITDTLSSGRYGRDISTDEVQRIMASEIVKVLEPVAKPLELDLAHKPHVVLVVGVNGTGKTTTIGKLAAKLREGGLDVMLAAGDTFRAAAIEQLKIWGERTGSPVVSSKLGADAAGLAFDAWKQAKEAGSDVLIIDTAGRLQNKAELMAELEKIVRVLGKNDPEAPHTVLQTLDATTGQNALSQVEIFQNVAGVNGLVMTKLDGTARGGILVAISAKHKLPVYFIGVGEGVEDLEPFEAREFASAIAGVPAGKSETRDLE